MNQNLSDETMAQKNLLKHQQQSLRQASQQAVKELSAAEVLIRSKRIAQNLKGILREKSKVCGIFYPMKAEPQVHTLKDEADLHVEFAFPDVGEEASSMNFYTTKKMIKHPLGFYSPDLTDESTQQVQLDTIVVPGLVFHATGIRIGRGGGFYDRYLSSFQGLRIGVCFEEQLLVDPWDMQTWDEKVHYVVTENRVIDCQRSGE